MRALVRRDGQLSVRDVAEAEPASGQVVAKVLACGICGSDLHAVHHLEHGVEIGLRSGAADTIDPAQDLVMGHEFCAEILDHGPATDKRLRAGARVVSTPFAFGPLGPELIGFSTRYRGAFAERVVLTEALLLPVPNGLSSDAAALTEPLAVGTHAVAVAAPSDRSVAMVIGCGPIGLAVIAALKRKGIGPVIAADFSPARRVRAERLGADIVVDPAVTSPHANWSSFDVPATLADLGLAQMAGRTSRDPLIFECVGVPGILQSLIENVPPCTHVIVVGACQEDDSILPVIAINKQLRFSFVFAYTPLEFAETLTALAEGQIDSSAFLTGRVTLDEAGLAFERLATPQDDVKIIVNPWR
ncbi:alcohol dehydrogenase [Sphingobium lactosutens]|uniref:zinc-binding dehydrogenase n=1 Tax=Sphingobium lactosutens TaxID=522773 RepID=UPI0015BA9B99|nr:zinc-binding dehydrogenase [Sphingobium lactosutens]NWK96241.1 alcohol dehydrogenase [Sphingobium lactosutens]